MCRMYRFARSSILTFRVSHLSNIEVFLSVGLLCAGHFSLLLLSSSRCPFSTYPVIRALSPVVISANECTCKYNRQLLNIWSSSLLRCGYVETIFSIMLQSFRRHNCGVDIGPLSVMPCTYKNSHRDFIEELGIIHS